MDIVEQLRRAQTDFWSHTRCEVLEPAATEIERLRRQNDKMRCQLEKIAAFEVHPYSAAKAVLKELYGHEQTTAKATPET